MNVGISVPLPAYLVDVGFMARKVIKKTEAEMGVELTRIADAVLR